MEYRVADYGSMIADDVRMNAYVDALELTVKPGGVVLDIGTGTGMMALVACRLGAERVIAVEPDGVIEVARQIARTNGFGDRIEFVHGRSTEIELAQRADVIVSDLRGVLPLHSGHIAAIADARRRLLAPGGVLIPKRDTLWAAVVEAPIPYQRKIDCWAEHARGFDLRSARELVTNTWWRERVEESQVLSERCLFATLDYEAIDDPELDSVGLAAVRRAGVAHGLCVWFDAELTEGEGFSNAPSEPEAIYGSAFFPLEHPVEVREGDAVHLHLRATLAGGDYFWRWDTSVQRGGQVLARYRQSTALGVPLTPALLQRSSAEFVPRLAREGEALKVALELMGGELNLAEIAARIAERFPEQFSDVGDGLHFVVRLAQKPGV